MQTTFAMQADFGCQSAWNNLLRSPSKVIRPFRLQQCSTFGRKRNFSKRISIQAALPDGPILAVTQQGAAFAVLLVGEGIYTRTQLASDAPGRPQILPILAGTLGLIAALGLLQIGEQGEQMGLIVGGVTSAMLLALNAKRSFDTENDDDWPGPKSWPIFVSTGAFFAMLAFFQSMRYL